MSAQPIASFINHRRHQSLLQRLDTHKRMLVLIRRVLPLPLRDHCRDCCRKKGALILFSDSPLWSSQLRFYAPAILTALTAEGGFNIAEIRVCRLPSLGSAPSPSRKLTIPSRSMIQLIKASMANSPSDELKAAFARLGETLERQSSA